MSQSYRDLEQGPVTIRAFRSLTQHHADTVSHAVSALSAAWAVEYHHDYDGYLSILISPAEPIEHLPSFLISGTSDRIELAEIRDDRLIQLGSFTTIAATVAELASHAAKSAGSACS